MEEHTHELDPLLRINGNKRKLLRDWASRNYRVCKVGDNNFGYYKGTYTEKYLKSNKDVDLIYFRNYVPNSFQSTSKKIDQWNRKFCIPYVDSFFDIAVKQTHRKCVPAAFFNHNLIIKGRYEVEIVNYSIRDRTRDGQITYYVPFISFSDAGGYSNCIIDFYVRVPIKRRLEEFNEKMSVYFKKDGHDLNKMDTFGGLPIVGLEYHYPHYDRELQIMYYDRMDVVYQGDEEPIASL